MGNTNFIPLDKALITEDNYYDICNPYTDRDIVDVLNNIENYSQFRQYMADKFLQDKQKDKQNHYIDIQTVQPKEQLILYMKGKRYAE